MADPLELVEIPIDQAAVAFVAHHEVIPGRHCARKAHLIVGTILMKRESLDVYTHSGCVLPLATVRQATPAPQDVTRELFPLRRGYRTAIMAPTLSGGLSRWLLGVGFHGPVVLRFILI